MKNQEAINDSFTVKANWNIYNQKYEKLEKFEYSGYKFKFNINNQKHMEEFIKLITNSKILYPWDVCNFFINRKIKYSVNFRILIKVALKINIENLLIVLYLKKSQFFIKLKKMFELIKN